MQNHILSIILFTPLLGALVLLFVPKENKDAIRWIANIFALAGLLVSLPLVPWFWAQRFETRLQVHRGRCQATGFLRSARAMFSASTAFRFC